MGGAIRTPTWRRWRAFRRAIKKLGRERAGPNLIPRPALQESLTNATRSYMSAEELSQLRTTLEIAYQSRVPDAAASEARLRHAVAVARVLAELRMEVEAARERSER